MARSLALQQEGSTYATIAAQLNAEGWRSAKRRATFTAAMVSSLLARQGLRSARPSPSSTVPREAEEWTLQELAYELAMPTVTLYNWLKQGKLKARREIGAGHPLWLVQADADELFRLKSWRAESHSHPKPNAAC